MNYDELNRFTESLTYSIRRFIIFFCHGPKGGHGTMTLPPSKKNLAVAYCKSRVPDLCGEVPLCTDLVGASFLVGAKFY